MQLVLEQVQLVLEQVQLMLEQVQLVLEQVQLVLELEPGHLLVVAVLAAFRGGHLACPDVCRCIR